ncbi:hypothetical protein [Nonomuraea sediminis]|uniref:hypothetical protein n=1 Tax=Nonomuraea sediminis TaxID=2835864 RepID=UPI001BDD470F|nr:hypothetical protein [Nonomuraea sediminis]
MRYAQEIHGHRHFPGKRGHHFRGPEGARRWFGGEEGDWEAARQVREAGARLLDAYVQASRTGSAERREKAKAIADEARRSLYRLLAEEQ